ncbi:MAG: ethanolamine ammonia-lyase subunit EutC [Paraglaciecola sp.]|nr:ethanolamine ammonia-lyase subunit EutC [Paraglaciecola sp.]
MSTNKDLDEKHIAKKGDKPVISNNWQSLQRFTDARIALGRVANSLPTNAHLAFQLDHARARDAVHVPLDSVALQAQLLEQGLTVLPLHSQAVNRQMYLQRPDLGRQLAPESASQLKRWRAQHGCNKVSIVIADGLSANAVQNQAASLLALLSSGLSTLGLSYGPCAIVQQGRVAVADEVAELLGSRLLVMFIGERPGLSSPQSLGIYFTRAPRVGMSDESRNCISNIHARGLSCQHAIERLIWLIQMSEKLKISGVHLKDKSGEAQPLLNVTPEQKPRFQLT